MKKIFFVLALAIAVKGFAQVPNTISAADKVYGLSKFWQEVNYNFVYLDKVDRQLWDSAYRTMIPLVQKTTNDYEYYRLLQKFCALLKDGHTNVWPSQEVQSLQLTRMFGDYWFGLQNIGGKAIVTSALKSKLKEIPIGSEITEVNGMPTEQYLTDSVMPYVSSSTDYVRRDAAIANLLQGLTGTSYQVKIKRPDGTVFALALTHTRSTDTGYYPPLVNEPLLELKWYEKDIAYLSLNGFGDPKIDTLFEEKLPELYKAKALIIDLRKNGGGSTNVGLDILQYLINDTLIEHSKYFTRDHLAAFKAWGKYVSPEDTLRSDWNKKAWHVYNGDYYYAFDYEPFTVKLDAKRLVVPTALLIGHNTASAAEDFLISADNQKHMVKIGEHSFGSTGQPLQLDLPGGGGGRICTKKDTYPDGRAFVGVGVIPDMEVSPTVKDFIEHKDPVLETALQYLRKEQKK